ncbi:uncharacterized protein ATC70_008430 [Mucor velutinosus]|uniref:F-box domain-containing protein n=1 Tax=Mucor velutinosus TaxID=708070 RepID=A0AAN7I419_9FUNG|nr:hypothetical protein ATC70_008430 [Mucor velutinosus]
MVPPPRKRLKGQEKHRAQGQKIDFVIKSFSKELVLKVFSFLSLKDLIQCAAVSLHWSRMANDEMLWKPLFIRRFRDPLYKEDSRSQCHYDRRTSVSRYNGSWKKKYRIHHNWLLGNCSIYDIVNHATTPLSPNHLQFTHDIVFTAQEGASAINMWRYQKDTATPHLVRRLQSIEQPDATEITFMKLIDDGTSTKHLIAGYANGGFTLWQVVATEVVEVANYLAASTTQLDKVTSIGMALPMMILYTESGKVSVFRINATVNSFELIHQLQSPMHWSPVTLDIHRYPSSKRELWKAVVCFGLSGGSYTTSVGIQEMLLSSDAILSSRHGFALNSEPVIPSGIVSSTSVSYGSSEKITAMAFSPPHLITAHANNTMKHYMVTDNKHSLEISFKQTLYGHTYRVDALAIDASKRRLVSGDQSGIKIWDLTTQSGECQVTIENYTNQSAMNELPDARINTLGFDEDKIVAIMSLSEGCLVRSWSFDP